MVYALLSGELMAEPRLGLKLNYLQERLVLSAELLSMKLSMLWLDFIPTLVTTVMLMSILFGKMLKNNKRTNSICAFEAVAANLGDILTTAIQSCIMLGIK